jgi:hypothetical protein
MRTDTLFFPKPPLSDQPVYTITDAEKKFAFRSLVPDTDIDFLFDWVNMPYSRKFWQMDGSISNLYALLRESVDHPSQHSFIGLYNDHPVCQIDLYDVACDELKEHIICESNDCGLHLLMCPPSQMTRGLSLAMLRHFMQFYFSFPVAARLFAEPDRANGFANRLAVKAGFQFVKTVQLSYKTANLYSVTKAQFYGAHPNP